MRTIDTEYAVAPLLASLAAGPVFLLSAALASGGLIPSEEITFAAREIGDLFIALPLVGVIGFLIALLPTFVGTVVMAQFGCVSVRSRLSVIWAGVGVAMIAIPVWLLGGFGHADIPLAATGGVCALICRRYTRWIESRDGDTAPATVTLRARDPDPRLLH